MASFGASMGCAACSNSFLLAPRLFQPRHSDRDAGRLGIRITPDQIALLALTALLVAAVHLLMTRTQAGREMRAVSQKLMLARVVGIDVAGWCGSPG